MAMATATGGTSAAAAHLLEQRRAQGLPERLEDPAAARAVAAALATTEPRDGT